MPDLTLKYSLMFSQIINAIKYEDPQMTTTQTLPSFLLMNMVYYSIQNTGIMMLPCISLSS